MVSTIYKQVLRGQSNRDSFSGRANHIDSCPRYLIQKRINNMSIIIEIPEEVTRKQISSIKECMDDMLSVDDIIGVLNGNEMQWKLSKNDGELLIQIKRG
jgi:hypothetical protein